MTKNTIIVTLLSLTVQFTFSQFSLDGEFKPRTEYRHGFGSIITETANPGYSISSRMRLNSKYATDSYTFFLSLQDVLLWGENRQLKPEDSNNSFSVFQAWADLKLGAGFTTKVGRQTLVYDDQRILGAVDWAQQARSHDAALLRYKNEKFSFDLGLAFNQDFSTTTGNPSGFQSVGTNFTTTGFFTYKTMQYVHLKQGWANFAASFLLLNNGFQKYEADGITPDGLNNLATLGTHLNYKKDGFEAVFNGYLQTGERQGSLDVKGAYLVGLELGLKASSNVGFGAGIEIISGNDGDTAGETGAFFPLYGTNHKFNGFMDYFYVGNHANSVGLIDVHLSSKFKLGEKSTLMAKLLNFSAEKALPSGEKSLGTELDLMLTKAFNGYTVQLGYSHLFPTDGTYELKGVAEADAASSQNWAWAMLVIKPKFLNTAKK